MTQLVHGSAPGKPDLTPGWAWLGTFCSAEAPGAVRPEIRPVLQQADGSPLSPGEGVGGWGPVVSDDGWWDTELYRLRDKKLSPTTRASCLSVPL